MGGTGYVSNASATSALVGQFASTVGGVPVADGAVGPVAYTTQALLGDTQSVVSQAFCVEDSTS